MHYIEDYGAFTNVIQSIGGSTNCSSHIILILVPKGALSPWGPFLLTTQNHTIVTCTVVKIVKAEKIGENIYYYDNGNSHCPELKKTETELVLERA